MYAIVRNKNGTFYTSAVFGYFCKVTAIDDYQRYCERTHNQFYIVLNESKDRLIKKFVFPWEDKYLDPQVLILNVDQQDWILDENYHGCVNFLRGIDFDADEIEIDPATLSKCIAVDSMQCYEEIVELKDETDIENLYCVSGSFHDAYIDNYELLGDTIHILFDDVWGCKIEMWFEGDVSFNIKEYDLRIDDPTWYDSTLIRDEGYFYLVNDGAMKKEDITDEYCWFRGRQLRYKVIPNS